jgi:hypothetical protein
MCEYSKENQLKVCCTCSFWSYQHKGYCHRLQQGAGKFWMCEDWEPAAAKAEKSPPELLEAALAGSIPG